MVNPESRLQQQAALARAARQQQRAKKERSLPHPHATAAGFDADLGLERIQLSDGSIRYAAPETNGAIGIGDPVLMHESRGATHVDAPPSVKRRLNPQLPKSPPVTTPFKVLFSVESNDIRKFYIGGDRPVPVEILSLNMNDVYIYDIYISNTGKKKDDWIVTLRYWEFDTNNVITRSLGFPEDTWQFSSPPSPNEHPSIFTEYRGGGVWLSRQAIYANTSRSSTIDYLDPNKDAESIIYPILNSPPFMSCGGEKRITVEMTGGNCKSDGTPYYVDGMNLYRPSRSTLSDNTHVDMGSFALFKNQSKLSIGEYRFDTTSILDRLCADNLEQRGTKDHLYTEQLTHFLSNTISGEITERFEAHGVYAGRDYNSWSAIVPEYREYEDANILVAVGGKTCISASAEHTEVVESYGKGSSVSETFIQSTSTRFFLNITTLKEKELNNSSSFTFVCGSKLDINENTTTINIPTSFYGISARMSVPLDIYTGYNNSTRTSEPLNFNFIGQPVKISQIANSEFTEYWTALGTISSFRLGGLLQQNSDHVRSAYITEMSINITEVKKTKYDYLASINGTVTCLNNSVFPLLYLEQGFFHPMVNFKGGAYQSVDYRFTNFIKDKIYFSRYPQELLSKSGNGHAEVWELRQNGDKLDAVQGELVSGKVYSLKAPTNYKDNPNIIYKIESVSCYA